MNNSRANHQKFPVVESRSKENLNSILETTLAGKKACKTPKKSKIKKITSMINLKIKKIFKRNKKLGKNNALSESAAKENTPNRTIQTNTGECTKPQSSSSSNKPALSSSSFSKYSNQRRRKRPIYAGNWHLYLHEIEARKSAAKKNIPVKTTRTRAAECIKLQPVSSSSICSKTSSEIREKMPWQ